MAKEMKLLWGSGSPPCWRIQITLHEKNLEGYNQQMLSFEKMEHKSKQVMDMNPRGQLPAFKVGDKVLNESYAACMYLECEFKNQGNKLVPECATEKALMFQRMFEAFALGDKMASVIYYNWKVPEGERHESAIQRNRAALTEELKLWEGYFSKKKEECCYLAGKTFSLADVLVFPTIAYAVRFGMCGERYPKLKCYYECLKDRPSIKATWPPTWLETPQSDLVLKDI